MGTDNKEFEVDDDETDQLEIYEMLSDEFDYE